MRSEFFFVLCWGLLSATRSRAMAETSPKPEGAVPYLEDAAAQAAGLSAREVKDASKLYTAKCMRCHKSYEAKAYPQPQWDAWMAKMSKKPALAREQSLLTPATCSTVPRRPRRGQKPTAPHLEDRGRPPRHRRAAAFLLRAGSRYPALAGSALDRRDWINYGNRHRQT